MNRIHNEANREPVNYSKVHSKHARNLGKLEEQRHDVELEKVIKNITKGKRFRINHFA